MAYTGDDTARIQMPMSQNGQQIPIFMQSSIVEMTAGAASSHAEVGAGKVISITPKADCYFKLGADGVVVAATGTNVGEWIMAGQCRVLFTGTHDYVAVIQDSTGGQVTIGVM